MRLKACDRLHPKDPGDVVVWARGGRQKGRTVCRMCQRILKKLRNPEAAKKPSWKTLGMPYGVIQLNWKAPEIPPSGDLVIAYVGSGPSASNIVVERWPKSS